MFGLTFEKLLLIGVIAVLLVGPDRLPRYAAQLAQLVRNLRGMADGAKSRMREEMGPEFDEVDWKKLDPRQYDPRRIIREALLDDAPATPAAPVLRKPVSSSGPLTYTPKAPPKAGADGSQPPASQSSAAEPAAAQPAPFDAEAT
jgi:sec-independent protein translocase protein TatB